MLYWSVVFLLIALLAAVLGFTAIEGLAAMIAKALFVLFLALFLVYAVRGYRHGGPLL